MKFFNVDLNDKSTVISLAAMARSSRNSVETVKRLMSKGVAVAASEALKAESIEDLRRIQGAAEVMQEISELFDRAEQLERKIREEQHKTGQAVS